MRSGIARIVRSGLVVTVFALCGVAFAADGIHWTITGPTSVTFDWRGSLSENTIAYGASAGNYTTTVTAANPTGTCVPYSSPGPFWEAPLTGLTADTVYHYSIAGGPDHTFRTAPVSTASFSVLVEGDVGFGGGYSRMPAVQQLMAAETDARFALLVGDLTYADTHTLSAVDDHFNDVMPWSRDIAYMPAWGNHEWERLTDDLRNYKGRFEFPNSQTSTASPAVSFCGEDWYWYDYGGVRFIAYPEPWKNDGLGLVDALVEWNTQATLLMNAAEADPNIRFIVTYGHRPAYSSGHHLGYDTLQGFLDELAASHSKYVLNLTGHSHNYERSFPQNGSGDNLRGAVHITVGTGGSNLEEDGLCKWLTCTQPSWSAARYFHLGYLKLTFTPTSIQGAFVCGPAGPPGVDDVTCAPGEVIDTFTITAAPPAPAIYVDGSNPLCSAAGTGTSAQPFCTITQGVNRAIAGNTVIVRAGTYPEDVKVTKSGTSTQPIVIKAEPGANVVVGVGQFRGFEISGRQWITIQGFTVSNTSSYGIYVASGSSHITIADNHVTRVGQPVSGSTKSGIYLSNTTDSVVSGNTADYNSDAGIALVGTTTGVTVIGNVSSHNARGYTRAAPGIDVRSGGNIIRDNISHHNEDSGIQVYSSGGSPSPNNVVVNNLCYDNGDHGIDVSSAGSQNVVGNTVYRNTTAGINIEGTDLLPSSGTTLRNNISVDNAIASSNTRGNIRVDVPSMPGTTIDYDLVYQSQSGPTQFVWGATSYATLAAFAAATAQEPHGIEADPEWVAPSLNDFHLATASPAIDSADSGASGALSTDIEGNPRVDDPAVANTGIGPRAFDDRGAFEHPACGNGVKEYGEECDGPDVGLAVCGALGCAEGDPGCTPQCTLDYGTCTGCPVCGNGIKEYGEDCDAADLGGASCESQGQCSLHGGLACNANCSFNTAGCSCGDNALQGGCGEVCDGTDLAGQTCASQGFSNGTLSCQSNCGGFVTTDCSLCGNGVRQGVEECDGGDLGGASCSNYGCFAGTPTCEGSCTLNYSTCTNCWGRTLYVDQANPACSNVGQGTAAAPFCTINAAAARVVAGGTVIVASGTYPEYVKVLTSGTPTAPITFKAAPGATVNVSGSTRGFELVTKSWVTIEGFNVSTTSQYGISLESNCSNITIRGNRVSFAGARVNGATKPGIYISASTNSLISGNTVVDNSDSGIYVTSGATNLTIEKNVAARNARGWVSAASGIELRSAGNTVRGNVCYSNEVSGIVAKPFGGNTPVPNNLIVNNVTYGNANHGIQLVYSDSSQIIGNTVYANLGSGIDLAGASTGCVVANNIAVDNALNISGSSGGNLRVEALSVPGTTLDYDLVFRSQAGVMISWSGTVYTSLAAFKSAIAGQEPHGLQGDPLWVAKATANFHLKLGSPAIDSASSSATGVQSTDIEGTTRTDDPVTANTGAGPRTYDDRGAYEYPLDADHDGYASDEDCDDGDPAINPGVLDVSCDGVDQDCSGQADEDFVPSTTATTCGVGACAAQGVTACVNHVITETCTPGPAAPNDAICNGIDDDCSGQVDEDFVPWPTACGVGACASTGVSSCVNGAVANNCTPGTPAASDATCDFIDDDCSGQVDEDFVPAPTACGVGACASVGVLSCVTGVVTDSCTPGTPAANDASCNGIDDDCSGQVDEDFVPGPTACGVGACASAGVSSCVNGVVADSCTPGTPAANDENCNGIDDDCSGQVDEDFVPAPTACGVGACSTTGVTSCVNGAVADSCTPGTPAATDASCNGIDDDCSGQVDEDFVPAPTACGVGACASAGVTSCVTGVVADSCTPGTPAASDATCDGIDDDCSGQVDEDFVVTPGASTCGVGACLASGQNTCVNGVVTDVCTPGAPTAEVCDGVDNNCNGAVDENFVSTPTTCGIGACQSTGVTACLNGVVTSTCIPGSPSPEVGCDGIDNDCNPATPDALDADGDATTCTTDCNDSDPSVHPGAPEINDAQDNQCPGGPGYGLIDETSGDSGFHTPGDKAAYSWPPQSGATGYEVARATSPNFASACQTAQTASSPWSDPELPTSGHIFYYLNRPSTPFTGSWGARSSGVERTGICPPPVDADGDGYPVGQDCDDTNPAINPGMPDVNCDGVDQNCSGQADEGFVSTPTTCGVGACQSTGATACVNGTITNTCTPGTPTAEVCDGIDNDCNGQVDDGLGTTTCGVGACETTVAACVAGSPNTCTPGTPTAEVCDGIDNDCNGQVDDGLGTTTCGVGACETTVAACVAGSPNTCTPGAPTAEVCDGIDNDCNGQVDDGLGTITCGVGACETTVVACVAGSPNTCTPGTPTAEICDGIDNDCNGQVDDGGVCP